MFNTNTSLKQNNPAKYRNRISFERFERIQNDYGHWEEDWVKADEIGSVYAQVRNIRGNEFIKAGANNVKVSARINIRYRPDIVNAESDLRINFNGRIFDIVYINNLEERNIELEIMVDEVRK